MNIIEFFDEKNLNDKLIEDKITAIFISRYKGKDPRENLTYSEKVIIYDSKYNYLGSYQSLNAVNTSKGLRIRGRMLNDNGASENQVRASSIRSTSNCQVWGMFYIVYDSQGNVQSETLLYTYYVGDDCANTQDSERHNYGGNGESNNEDPYAIINRLTEELEEYSQQLPMINNNIYCNPVEADGNYYEQSIKWDVAKQLYGLWSVEATTSITYSKDRTITDPNTMQFSDSYNISAFTTQPSAYRGTNILIASTWAESQRNSEILFNNSPQAKGKVTIAGTIIHRSVYYFPPTVVTPPVYLNKTTLVNQSVNIIPR
jgi:hypothetical protein